MSFKVSDNKLLKEDTKLWENISNLMNTEFDSEHVYGDNDKCIKTQIKSYGGEIKRTFQSKETPRENASYKYICHWQWWILLLE